MGAERYVILDRMRTRVLAASVALLVVGATGVAIKDKPRSTVIVEESRRAVVATVAATTSTTLAPTTTAPPPPPPTAAAAPPTAPPTTSAIKPFRPLRTNAALQLGTATMFRGFGAWIDVFDWSAEFTGGKPTVGPHDIDRMADFGVQTLYVQAARWRSSNDIVDSKLLRPLIDRAHARGMRVITWYVPTFEDTAFDLRRLLAIASLGIEGIAVDIESRAVADAAERNRRLVDLSIALRQHLPNVPIAAVVMPAVQMEVVNPSFWPGFPYREIAPAYDAWMPMSYWTSRRVDSGYRDAYRYTAENIDRLRANVGRPDLPVHPIGGIGDVTSEADIDGLYRAATERGSLGGSIYDYRTTHDALWARLKPFRSPN